MAPTPKSPVKSLETAILLVETLDDLEGAGVTEIADEAGIAKSTVHDHLKTLEAHEFIVKEDDHYRLALRFLDYGGRARLQKEVFQTAKPELKKLAENTGEIANLVVEEHGLGIYIDVVRGRNAVNLDTYVGKREYLHSTAVGKAILAHLPPEETDSILSKHGLPQETDNTTTSIEALYEELETIRERGYATDKEERLSGLRCVAAPIVPEEGRVYGGVSVSGPASRMEDERLTGELADEVKRITNIIEVNVLYP